VVPSPLQNRAASCRAGRLGCSAVRQPARDSFSESGQERTIARTASDHPVLCSYDLSTFSANTMMYALLNHPLVIIGGILQENPFCVDPDRLLSELRERRLSGERAELAH
jgi:hypothetical protein